MLVLAIETSCDDTAAAVVRDNEVLSNVISSQDIHNHYGGIVPELASREHVRGISQIVDTALSEAGVELANINCIAVTNGPGLAGSLLVGTHFAKGLALRFNKPIIPINHIEAHVYSGYLENPSLEFPSVCLVVSGGHTSIFLVASPTQYSVLGSTKDDAAGEAFDKIAKLVGLGYPGGPHVDRLSAQGDNTRFEFPRGLINEQKYDFSFSGLKTAVRREVERLKSVNSEVPINHICASAQTAIVDVLVAKTIKAAINNNVKAIVIAGGVSANSELRLRMASECESRGLTFVAPGIGYCVDNAAMIAFVAVLILRGNQDLLLAERNDDFTIVTKAIRAD